MRLPFLITWLVEIHVEVKTCKRYILKSNMYKLISYRATQIRQAYTTCPNTKVIVSGYSQGGQIVHNAIALLDAVTASWISKVVIFGDPGMYLPYAPTKFLC